MPFNFGLTRKKFNSNIGSQLDEIADRHGASFIGPLSIPGSDLTGWFEGPNRGEPFDRNLQRDVTDAIEQAGLVWVFDPTTGDSNDGTDQDPG